MQFQEFLLVALEEGDADLNKIYKALILGQQHDLVKLESLKRDTLKVKAALALDVLQKQGKVAFDSEKRTYSLNNGVKQAQEEENQQEVDYLAPRMSGLKEGKTAVVFNQTTEEDIEEWFDEIEERFTNVSFTDDVDEFWEDGKMKPLWEGCAVKPSFLVADFRAERLEDDDFLVELQEKTSQNNIALLIVTLGGSLSLCSVADTIWVAKADGNYVRIK